MLAVILITQTIETEYSTQQTMEVGIISVCEHWSGDLKTYNRPNITILTDGKTDKTKPYPSIT